MNIKIGMLAALLLAAVPFSVKAQDVSGYDNYRVACESGAECNDFNVDYEKVDGNDEVAQTRRTRRTRRTRNSEFKKIYVGGNLGAFFPGDDADVGFGLGGLVGYNFAKNLAAELEIYDYFGGTDIDDLGYNFFGVAANGVYKFPFGDSSKSPYGFAGAGLGLGVVSATGDVADEAEDAGADTSETGFLFQGKVGAGYPVTDKIDLLGQFRYLTISTDDGDGDAFSLDAGFRYNL